jgi:hypothetical protein
MQRAQPAIAAERLDVFAEHRQAVGKILGRERRFPEDLSAKGDQPGQLHIRDG